METYKLGQASCGWGLFPVLNTETFDRIAKAGFNIKGTQIWDEDSDSYIYENSTISFGNIADFSRFVDLVGDVIVEKEDGITIYDDYVE